MKRFILSSILIAIVINGFSQKHIRLSFFGSPSVNWMKSNSSIIDHEKLILGYDFGLSCDFYFSADERYSLLNRSTDIKYRRKYCL